MATLAYANTGTGVIAGGLGWINFGVFSITAGQTINNITATLRDGSILSFSLTNTTVSGGGITFVATAPPTFGGAPFGVNGYTGITGRVVLYMSAGYTGQQRLTMSNITVTDPFGVPVQNYTIYVADGEATGTNESIIYTTNGTPWTSLTTIGAGTSPATTGFGTNTVTSTGNSISSLNAPVIASINPTTVSAQMNITGISGLEGVVFGISISKVSLNKVINSRYNSSDQFQLNIAGDPAASTITFGNTFGAQPVSAYSYASIPSGGSPLVYTLSEAMAPGSATPLTSYSSTISYTNLTPGGTPVPTSTTIPRDLSLALADIVVATITNTIIPTTVTSAKSAISFTDINSVVTYTLTFNNLGPATVNNVVLKDTIQAGTTYQTDSVEVNGVSITGNPSPPTGIAIGTLPVGITTITFKVLVSTVPNPNPFLNTASFSYNYDALPTGVSGSTNTNTVSTRVNNASLINSKQVNKNFANIGDVLTYTIPITNTGSTTPTSITFIDTIPNGTSLVAGSLKQDGNNLVGDINPPGITINNIAPGKTSTIVFRVTILTIPNPNPIPNNATTVSQYIIDPSIPINGTQTFGSNTVNTQINNASLGGIIKYVDKSFATCGDIITYTIITPNSGNVTAINVIVKDTIPNGTTLLPTTVYVNGVQQNGAFPSSGITIPNIAPGTTATINFSVQVQC